MDIFLLIITLGLINYRLCILIMEEDAPFGLAIRFRMLLNIESYYKSETDNEKMKFEDVFYFYKVSQSHLLNKRNNLSELSRLFSCIWCLSIWIGFFLCLIFNIHFLFAFATSTIAVIVNSYIDREG